MVDFVEVGLIYIINKNHGSSKKKAEYD